MRFRYPATADPPPRLAAFAFPESIDEELLDQPCNVCFCLTLSDGSRVHGSALQICDLDPAASDGVTVRALVLLLKCSPDALPRDGRYTKAAEQGNAQAQNSLAYCYRYGHGVKADKAEAVRL